MYFDLCYGSGLTVRVLPAVCRQRSRQSSALSLVLREGRQLMRRGQLQGHSHTRRLPWALVRWGVSAASQELACQLPGLHLVTSALAARSWVTGSLPLLLLSRAVQRK